MEGARRELHHLFPFLPYCRERADSAFTSKVFAISALRECNYFVSLLKILTDGNPFFTNSFFFFFFWTLAAKPVQSMLCLSLTCKVYNYNAWYSSSTITIFAHPTIGEYGEKERKTGKEEKDNNDSNNHDRSRNQKETLGKTRTLNKLRVFYYYFSFFFIFLGSFFVVFLD